LEIVLFGTSEPAVVSQVIDGCVRTTLGVPVGAVGFFWRGVRAVFGLHLADGRDVVVNAHRADLVGKTLQARWRLQQHPGERQQPF
jgi:hypothetical protein